MWKVYIKPDMFPAGNEPFEVYEDEGGTFFYMGECQVCRQAYRTDQMHTMSPDFFEYPQGCDGNMACDKCVQGG